MAVTIAELAETFSQLVQPVRGDSGFSIAKLAAPRQAESNHLIFVQDRKHLEEAKKSKSQIWIVPPSLVEQLPSTPTNLLSSPNGQLAVALIGRAYFEPKQNKSNFGDKPIHPTAVIHETAVIGRNVIIGPNTTIGARVKIDDGVIIGPNTTIEADVEIGERSHIHAQVFIGHSTSIGKDVEIQPQTAIGMEGFGYAHDRAGNHFRMTHFGRIFIEDRVQIGSNVSIDRGTFEDCRFGAGTVIDNHCHFGHNNVIGKNNIITAGMISAGSVTIGDNCTFGGRCSITGHIKVASGSQFAGLSGIHKPIEKGGAYGGYPLQSIKRFLKTTATLGHLIEMRKDMSAMMKHLGLKEAEEK